MLRGKASNPMTLVILLPLAVALVGALMYGLASAKAGELGRIMFAMGLLATLLHVSAHMLSLP